MKPLPDTTISGPTHDSIASKSLACPSETPIKNHCASFHTLHTSLVSAVVIFGNMFFSAFTQNTKKKDRQRVVFMTGFVIASFQIHAVGGNRWTRQ